MRSLAPERVCEPPPPPASIPAGAFLLGAGCGLLLCALLALSAWALWGLL